MKAKKTQNKWPISDKIIMGLQLLTSIVFLILISRVLPFKYWGILTVVLVLLDLIVFLKLASLTKKAGRVVQKAETGIKNPYKSKKRRTKVVSFLLSIVLIVGCLAAGKGLGALDNIAGEKYQTQLITVVVKTDSPYEKISDIDGTTLGLVPSEDIEKALSSMQENENISVSTL